MVAETVYILLAAYNGEKYIAEQINSILSQSYKNWKLLIRDDGSKDETSLIIKNYANDFPAKIFILNDGFGNLGSVQNFNTLIQYAKEAGYIMFCDQDDVWLPDKIQITLSELLAAEHTLKVTMPLLVHTNFIYADNNLNPIQSKKNYRALKTSNLQFNHLLAQNPVYGCTMMFNNALAKYIDKIPAAAENHDYWVALTAAAFGKIIYLEQPTMLYRQHDKNISTNYDNSSFKKRLLRIRNKKNWDDVYAKQKMALAFKEVFYSRLNSNQQNMLNTFLEFFSRKNLRLLRKNIGLGIKRQTPLQTLLFYMSILFSGNKVYK